MSGARAVYEALRKLARARREPGAHCICVGKRSELTDEDMSDLRMGAVARDATVDVVGLWVWLDYSAPTYDWGDVYADPPEGDYL